MNPFIGREDEIEKLFQFVFHTANPKVLGVIGNSGIGKSTLVFRFLELIKTRLKNGYSLYHDSFIQFKDHKKDISNLIIIEDFSNQNREIEQLVKYTNDNPKKRIIFIHKALVSHEERYDFFGDISPYIHKVYLDGLTNMEIYDLLHEVIDNSSSSFDIQKIFTKFQSINPYDKHGNPRTILSTINYLIEENLSEQDLDNVIINSFSATTLVDQYGNPININSSSGNKIINSIILINDSILNKVQQQPSQIYNLSSREFEFLVAELLEKDGYKVNITKATHDGGKDLMLAENSNLGSFMFYVECKRYAPDNHVGVNLIRELYGTIQSDKATAGLFVTSSYFSKDAYEFQEKNKYQISLKDYYDLVTWINTNGVQQN